MADRRAIVMPTWKDPTDVRQVLALRKVTKAISEHLRHLVKDYLSTLAPLLRPRSVFGDYVSGSGKEIIKGAEKAFRDLQSLYEATASAKPFQLPRELHSPFEVLSSTPEIHPVESPYSLKTEQEEKQITISCPLKWTLTYSGFSPARLKELLTDKNRNARELQEFLLHYLVLHVVLSRQTGAVQVLRDLHFPVVTEYAPELGSLPLTRITSVVTTICPPDALILESTELSGMNVFEQIVQLEDIFQMPNAFKEGLLQIVRAHHFVPAPDPSS